MSWASSPKQWEKDLVYGYTREADPLIDPLKIPSEITDLCLLYHHDIEYFHCSDLYEANPNININETKQAFEVKRAGGNTAYGNIDIITPFTYSWTFDISGFPSKGETKYHLSIGICESSATDTRYFSGIFAGHKYYTYFVDHGSVRMNEKGNQLYGIKVEKDSMINQNGN